ncbi:proteasome assembly chaperone 4-like [Dysidea avara]|uniref:proteasome assembly chaperone 4-like n=1 Tax=Dysidea avara TaxID=196820 RepID=UPI003329B5FC
MEPVETITKSLHGTEIYFYYLKMKASIFIWVGRSPATLKELTVAMDLPGHTPSQSQLMGKGCSSQIASRIAEKYHCQVFLSCNIDDPTLLTDIEQIIKEHLEQSSQQWQQLAT